MMKLEYNGYQARVEYDVEDNIFIGEVSNIKDSLNFHAKSISEAKAMFEQSIDNYIELCQMIGKTAPKTFQEYFNDDSRVSPEMREKVKAEVTLIEKSLAAK